MKTKREDEKSEAEPTREPTRTIMTPAVVPPSAPAEPAEPQITVGKFVRALREKDLAGAYVHVEKLRKPIRKMGASEWKKDYDAWLLEPRG